MLIVIGQVLPLALALALSSVPIASALTLLLRNPRRSAAGAFAVGYTAGMAGLVGLLASFLPVPLGGDVSLGVHGLLEIALGVAVVVLGIVTARRPAGAGRLGAGLHRLTGALGGLGPVLALLLGITLDLRPKSVLVAGTIGVVIAGATPTGGEVLVATTIATALGASTVIVPVVVGVVRRGRARAWLEAFDHWITRNGRTVTVVVLFVIGAVVIGNGLGSL